MQFEYYTKEISILKQETQLPVILENIEVKEYCCHSDEYQDHKACAVFEPSAFMIYEYDIKRYVTNNEKEEIQKITLKEVPENADKEDRVVKELINDMCRNLENAYYYKVAYLEIKEGVILLTVDKLIALNNIVTAGAFVMLRQKQMLCWAPEKKHLSGQWMLDVSGII